MTSVSDRRLKALVKKDRDISAQASSVTLALMEHRWNAVQEMGSARAYARALGIQSSVVDAYVRAWRMWQEEGARGAARTHTPSEVLELAKMGEQKRAAVEAVADAKGIGARAVRERHMSDVRQVQQVMRAEPDLETSITKGRQVAHNIETVRKAAAGQRKERARTTPAAYLDLENHVSKANRALTEALGIARDEHLDDEYVALALAALEKTKAILELIATALSGKSVDWDAELQKLEAGQ